MVLWLKNASKNGEESLKKGRNCFDQGTFGDRTSAYSAANVPSRFYLGDLVTRTGDREIRSVSGRLPDYPGASACQCVGVHHCILSRGLYQFQISLFKIQSCLNVNC